MAKKQEMETQRPFEEIKKENEAYAEKLSKRSVQYIYELRKILSQSMNVDSQERALNDILPKLITAQRQGITARQLFGPVADMARLVIEGPKEEPKEMPFWQMWLDNTLMVFVLLGAFGGIISLFLPNPMVIGITSMILSAMCGGVVFWAMYHFIYRYDRPGADKSKKPKTWKSIVIILGLMLIWMAILQASMTLLPPSWNPALTPIWMLIVSVLVYGVRYVLKKTLGYSGSFFSR